MAAATLTPTETVVKEIRGLNDRLTPIEGLLKALGEPARRAGLSPEALLARMVDSQQGQNFGVVVGGDGAAVVPLDRLYHGGLGEVRDRKSGQALGKFNEYLDNLYWLAKGGPAASARQIEYLNRLGVSRLVENNKEGTVEKAALAESTGVTGGYTVPPMFAQELMMLAIEGTIVPQRARKQPLTSRTLQVPSLDVTTAYAAGTTPFLGGVLASWTSEAATRAETEPQFRQTVLTAWELSFYTVASNTLLADQAVGLDSLLTQLFSVAIGWYTDYAFLRGDGVGKPLGILNCPACLAVTRNQANSFNFVDVAVMLSKFYWMLRGGNAIAWVIHPTVIAHLYRMNDMSASQTGAGFGRVLFVPIDRGAQEDVPQSAGVQSIGRLAGFPVLVSEKLPALGTQGCVMLADFSQYLLGTRQELQIDVSPHVNFLKNQMTWRVVWRGDGQPWLNNAITLQDGVSTVSPFLQLTQ